MPFSKDTCAFPTEVHKRIHIVALSLTPPDVSLADTDGVDRGLVRSCRAYYAFILSMLEDMYEDPDTWGMNPGEYDAFLAGRTENAMKQKAPSKTLELRSKTYNCVYTYLRLLMLLGAAGTAGETGMILSAADFSDIKKRFDDRLAPKKKTLENAICYETRLGALSRVGFAIDEGEDMASVSSERFPNMFTAMCALAKSADNVKTFGEQGFINCEFRQIFSGYTPRYEDVVQPLDGGKREVFDLMHAYALENKLQPSLTTFWKVNYKWKGAQVMQISTEGNNGCIWITGGAGNNPEEREHLNALLAAESPEFQRYALRHLKYCTACSTTHLGGFVTVLGKLKRVCSGGGIDFRVYNPTSEDLPYIKRLIEFKRELILKKNQGNRLRKS